jgi:hypothetical protein
VTEEVEEPALLGKCEVKRLASVKPTTTTASNALGTSPTDGIIMVKASISKPPLFSSGLLRYELTWGGVTVMV